MEGSDDLELLASLLEENEAVELGSKGVEDSTMPEEADEFNDLFDADDDDDEEGGLLMDDGGGDQDDSFEMQGDDVHALFGDVDDIEEDEEEKYTSANMSLPQNSEKEMEKSTQDLEEELRKMQEQMQKLQEQLQMAAAGQKVVTSTTQRSPESRKNQLPGKSISTSLKEKEPRKLYESPAFSSQLTSPGLVKVSQRVAHKPKSSKTENKSPPQKFLEKNPPSSLPLQPSNKPNAPQASTVRNTGIPGGSRAPDQDVTVEKFSGLRLRRPRVSSMEMERKMTGRKLIRLSQLQDRLSRDKLEETDWVTFAVLIKKITPQSSNSGKTFSIWRLNDLRNLEVCISLFLFGDVHQEHWKTDQGTVIGLLNASFMKPKEGSDEVCLSVDHPQKILLMGEALDMGNCKARKKNGDPCTQIVNLNDCEYCQYHVKAQYKKLSSKRADLQSTFSGRAPAKIRGRGTGLKERLCQQGFYYGGVSSAAYAASVASAAAPKKPVQTTLSNLVIKGTDAIVKETQQKIAMSRNGTMRCTNEFKELLDMPSPGALNLKKHFGKAEAVRRGRPAFQSISASELLKQQKQQMLEVRKKRAEDIQKRFLQNTGKPGNHAACPGPSSLLSPKAAAEFPKEQKTVATPQTPKLGRGFSEGEEVLFFDVSRATPKLSSLAEAKKLAAINKLRAKSGMISKEDPNNVKRKRDDSSAVVAKVNNRVEKSLESSSQANEDEPTLKRRREQLAYLESEEFQKILNAKSKHVGAVKEAEIEIQEQYFDPLVKKEQMEEKMRNIREVKCRVVTCKTCNYTHFKPLDTCVSENHDFHWYDGVKRFFKCKCGNRAMSLDRLPHKHCSNCGLFQWERDGMLKEKAGPKIGGELLLTRGEEHAKFINSLK
nr:PREDICTED: protein MCM10 homolog [Latimeria chalumnae]|eukprot:XP_006013141.1 PREDICTED: protein MCM10 homolog [Latimeria chalumnae]